MSNHWIEFWDKDDFWKASSLWKHNAALFLRYSLSILSYSNEDKVLNIGCGAGHLEEILASKVGKIIAADTSPNLLEECRKKCATFPNVKTHLLGSDYLDLSNCGTGFSLFLCVSVVQYYHSSEEIIKLVDSARKIALPGARMLIADLPIRRNFSGFFIDAFSSALKSIKEGYFLSFLTEGTLSFFDKKKKQPCLEFTLPQIEKIATQIGHKTQVIHQGLSIYANRPSLLIHF